MMKTLCVAVVLLSLTSVCQPASLACEKLLKPVEKGPNLPGRWYVIAWSSGACFLSTLVNVLVWPSVEININSTTTSVYEANFQAKVYGYCSAENNTFIYENNRIFDVDKTAAADRGVLLQSGCPDCVVMKEADSTGLIFLFSRRKVVTADELREFETQSECLGLSKPQVLNTDHDYVNCRSFDDDEVDDWDVVSLISQRLKNSLTDFLECFQGPTISFKWAQETWDGLW